MIVARASTREAERKLLLAGADRVVQPYASAGTEMAKLAFKPQVAAFLELVSGHAGPDLRFEEIEVSRRLPGLRPHDPRAPHPQHDRRRRDRPAQARRTLRRHPEPGRRDQAGRRADRDRDRARAEGARRPVRAGGRWRLAPSPAWRPRSASSQAARSRSSGRRTPRTATTRRTSRCRRREPPGALRARSPRSSPRRRSRCPRSRAPRSRARASSTCGVADAFLGQALAEIDAGYGGGWAAPPERIQVEMVSANPTGPITVAVRAQRRATGTASRGCSSSPATTVEREYYYNDAGAQMDRFRASVEAVRRGRSEPPEDGYHGAYIADLARADGRPRSRDARADRVDARALPHPLRLVGQAERARARARRAARGAADLRAGGRALSSARPSSATTRTGSLVRSAGKAACRPTRRPTSRTCATSSSAASTGRSTCSAPTTTASRAGSRSSRGCSATTRAGSRCCSTSSSISPVAASRRRCRSAAATSSSSTSSSTRSASTSRAGSWSTAGTTSRSRSTSTSRPRRSRKNPVYYVQYVHARISGIFREAPEGAELDPVPRMPLAAEERRAREASAEFPAVVREATERRGPHAIPVYAIRLADDFHRFYHEHVVLDVEGRRAPAVSPRPDRRHARRRRPQPRPRRRRRAGADVDAREDRPSRPSSPPPERSRRRSRSNSAARTRARPGSASPGCAAPGWEEPAQRPSSTSTHSSSPGCFVVEHDGGTLEIRAGEAVHARFGERVRYSTPDPGGAEYIAICVPAFSPQGVNREEK